MDSLITSSSRIKKCLAQWHCTGSTSTHLFNKESVSLQPPLHPIRFTAKGHNGKSAPGLTTALLVRGFTLQPNPSPNALGHRACLFACLFTFSPSVRLGVMWWRWWKETWCGPNKRIRPKSANPETYKNRKPVNVYLHRETQINLNKWFKLGRSDIFKKIEDKSCHPHSGSHGRRSCDLMNPYLPRFGGMRL